MFNLMKKKYHKQDLSTIDQAIESLLATRMSIAEIERLIIEAAVTRYKGSVPRAARHLDVSPSTLYRKREAWQAKD